MRLDEVHLPSHHHNNLPYAAMRGDAKQKHAKASTCDDKKIILTAQHSFPGSRYMSFHKYLSSIRTAD